MDASFSEQLSYITENINRYKKEVIDQKYSNSLSKLQTLLADLRILSDFYFQVNQRNFTKEVAEKLDSNASQALDYITKITLEMRRFILEDTNLNSEDAEILLAQNNYIKNFTLEYELWRMIGYYENASAEVFYQYRDKTQREFEERFVVCVDYDNKKKYILREYAESYQKMVEMKKNVNQILVHDLQKLESLYNSAVEVQAPIELGELTAEVTNLDYYLLTEKQIKEKMVLELDAIRKLEKEPGMKKKYHFILDGKRFKAIVPTRKKPIFEKHLKTLSELQCVLKELDLFKHVDSPTSEQNNLLDIKIDRQMLSEMTLQQQGSYLDSIMKRVEGSQSTHVMQVTDYQNKRKEIPTFYYSVYEECKELLYQLSITIDHNYVKTLNVEDKTRYYERILDKIKQSTKEPFVMVDNVRVSADYYRFYMNALTALTALTRNPRIGYNTETRSYDDKTINREYKIDESYVETLSDELKLSYYANLIGKIAMLKMSPIVVYESFGVKLNIPINLISTVQECERRALRIKEKIRGNNIHTKSPEMQYSYYGEMIGRMKNSNKEPKIMVEAFEEQFEIPLEYQASFEECIKRMEDLTNKINRNGKRRKVKKVKKSITKRVQEFWKKKINRVKVVVGLTVTIGAALVAGSYLENLKKSASLNESIQVEQGIENVQDEPDSSINYNTKIPKDSYTLENEKIERLAFNANQSLASSFGAVIRLNQESISVSHNDFSNAMPIYQSFQNDLATVVKISIRMPDNSSSIINFFDENAQQNVNQKIEQGGIIESVGIVASQAEQNYYQTGNITGYIKIDGNTNLTSGETTKLSQDVGNYLTSGRSR